MEKILKAKTLYQSVITSSSTILNGALGILFYILVARLLGPESFGIFSVSVITLTLIADVANIGTDTGIVKFVGSSIHKKRKRALMFLKLGLETKIVIGVSFTVIGLILTPTFSHLLHKPELMVPLRYAVLGAFGLLLFLFTTSALQAIQKFWTWGVLNISMNFLRLMSILAVSAVIVLDLEKSLFLYIIFPFLGSLVGILLLPRFFTVKRELSVSKEFFNYNKWIAILVAISAVSSRLDMYLAVRLLTLAEVGVYSVAVNLAGVVPQIVLAIAVVAAPKLASFDSDLKARVYLKKLQIFVLTLAGVGLLVGTPLARILVPVVYGSKYVESISPFIILLTAQAIFLISIPAHTAVTYYFSSPKILVWMSIVHLAIVGILGLVLISNYGYIGAAATVLAGSISSLIIPGTWTLNKFRNK